MFLSVSEITSANSIQYCVRVSEFCDRSNNDYDFVDT